MIKPVMPESNEASVETRIVLPLLQQLGYAPDDIDPKFSIVFREGRRGRKPEADFVVFSGLPHNAQTSLIVVEAKPPGESFANAKGQAESYTFAIRAPFTLITDGLRLEIWQFQPTFESELILSVPVEQIETARGKIEAILSKDVVIAYARSLQQKSILIASQDFGTYEAAEIKRTAAYANVVERTLTDGSGGDEYRSDQLLAYFAGAVVVAPSGLGKTSLSYSMLRQAITTRSEDRSRPIPVHVPLEDVDTSETVLDFLQARIGAYKPGLKMNGLHDVLRENGVVLLCDSFDRLSVSDQECIQSELRNLIRDFPRCQVFVFSRAASQPQLSLPVLTLKPLTSDQQCQIVKTFQSQDLLPSWITAPTLLHKLCTSPLLLKRTLDYKMAKSKFPTDLQQLFRAWLDVSIRADPRQPSRNAAREKALTLIAVAQADRSLNFQDVVNLIDKHHLDQAIIDDLVQCDVIRFEPKVVIFEHEALSDYLRALEIADQKPAEILTRLHTIRLEAESLFPVLLAIVLPSVELRDELWRRLLELDIRTYVNVLRYRADLSDNIPTGDADGFAHRYLTELLDGLEAPLISFFSQIQRVVRRTLVDIECDSLAVLGNAGTSDIQYAFLKREDPEPRVIVRNIDQMGCIHGVGRHLSDLFADSGRLLGAHQLRDAILEVVDKRWFHGGSLLAAERLLGRMRFLNRQHGLPFDAQDTLREIEERLRPHTGMVVMRSDAFGQPVFWINDMLTDLKTLQLRGVHDLDAWWSTVGLGDNEEWISESDLASVLNEHFRRVELLYHEIVSASFAPVADQLRFYGMLPVRWFVNVVRRKDPSYCRPWIEVSWFPVGGWEAAGADIEFSDAHVQRDRRDHFYEVSNELQRLGRHAKKPWVQLESGFLPFFDGSRPDGRFDGETSAFRKACELVRDDINILFEELPSRYPIEELLR